MENYKYIYKHRRGTADQWKNSEIIPEEAELIVELDEENYKHKLKLGDGIHTYENLSYLTAGGETVTQTLARTVSVTLYASAWEEVTCESDPNIGYYKQILNIDGIVSNSKVDLQPTADMIAIFQSKNLAFVTETVIENDVPTIICYSIGSTPSSDYTLQATVTEVEVDGNNIIGNTVSTIPNLDDYATKSFVEEGVETALTQAKESGEFDGTSVTIASILESTEDDGNNIVTFSDGNTLTVQNGSQGVSGVYVGPGDMPNGYNVQIDPDGDLTDISGVYVGSGEMPEGYNVQIDPDGDVIDEADLKGADGYTPQKGTDYWTEEDKAEINADNIAFITTELAKRGQLKPEFANDVDELESSGDTSKLYVLPDGYIWAYMSVIVPSVPLYTNLAVNFQEGHRFNSSGVTVEAAGATVCEDYIGPLTNGDIIRIKGFGGCTDYNSQWLNVNKVNYSCSILSSSSSHYSYDYDSETGIVAIKKITDSTSFSYFRVSGKLTGTTDDVIITLNEEIKESAPTTGYQWANTGHAFVPANYEDRIIAIEEDVADMKDDILKLQNENNSSGGTSSETVTIPSYWESMVAEKTEIVKSLQTAGGKDCVCFVWASDTHIPDNDCGRTTDIGKVMAKMLDNCEIPFAVLSGDINTRASYSTEEKLLNAQKQMPIHLSPIWGTNRLLMALGNHDGCWGDSTGYYKHQFSPEEMWQAFFRGQALDFRRVFSNDGLYFYVDNTAQKTRFIVLNSHFGGDYAEDDNGWAVNDRFATSCYGQEQLEWLANIALDMPEGYGAIITAHVPPNIAYTVDKEQFIGIVNAYCNKTTYSGNYTAGVDGWTNNNISVDFSNAKGELIAMFTGHIHGDSIDTTTMDCPILTILSAGAKANEHNGFVEPEGGRTAGTDTETSFDVVTINKQTRTIDCIRVGAGIDREVNY